jgi:hypothetical protein
MVVFHRDDPASEDPDNPAKIPIMYVASGRLHWYVQSAPDRSEWDLGGKYGIPQPGGKISALAVTKDDAGVERLYALCHEGNGVNATLRYIESKTDSKWRTISSGTIQTIYADPDGDRLFAGTGISAYNIQYVNDGRLRPLISDSALLSGVVYREEEGVGTYYLSTRGDGTRGGIFKITETASASNPLNVEPLPYDGAAEEKDNHRMFMSMIKLKGTDTIIAVERDGGALYEIKDGFFERMQYIISGESKGWINIDKYATEALTLWEEIDFDTNLTTSRLLVVGIQGGLYSTITSSHTYGYVEFELNPNDGFQTIERRRDPGNLLSVSDDDRYTTSLGKHPVNHLFQTPQDIDSNMTFFASTQTAGLWSYRNRSEGPQWNAEE